MSKREIIIAAAVGVLLVVVAGVGMYFLIVKKEAPSLPRLQSRVEVGEDVYQDSSGFSFRYPQNTTVFDVTPDEQIYYSVLEIVPKDKAGNEKIILTLKDTESSTIEEWLSAGSDIPHSALVVGATTLGGIPAKQYSYNHDGQQFLATVALDQGVLYLITAPKSKTWEKIHDTVTSSFAFVKPQETSISQDEGTVYEEEETVE